MDDIKLKTLKTSDFEIEDNDSKLTFMFVLPENNLPDEKFIPRLRAYVDKKYFLLVEEDIRHFYAYLTDVLKRIEDAR